MEKGFEIERKSASTGERPRKFSLRKKSKEDEFCVEYRKNAREILETSKESPDKVPKMSKTALDAAFVSTLNKR